MAQVFRSRAEPITLVTSKFFPSRVCIWNRGSELLFLCLGTACNSALPRLLNVNSQSSMGAGGGENSRESFCTFFPPSFALRVTCPTPCISRRAHNCLSHNHSSLFLPKKNQGPIAQSGQGQGISALGQPICSAGLLPEGCGGDPADGTSRHSGEGFMHVWDVCGMWHVCAECVVCVVCGCLWYVCLMWDDVNPSS